MFSISDHPVERWMPVVTAAIVLCAALMSKKSRKPVHKVRWGTFAIYLAPVCLISLMILGIRDRYVYILMLGLAGLAIVVASIIWMVRTESGVRDGCRDAAKYVAGAFLIPLLIFIIRFNSSPSAWWLLIGPPLLLAHVPRLVNALFRSTVTLQSRPLTQKKSSEGLRIAHLSDLHICTEETLGGGLSSQHVGDAARKALKWALSESPDLVALTGDVTDAGLEGEWEVFQGVLAGLTEEEKRKIVVVPGNHDMSTPTTEESISSVDGRLVVDFENRCVSFLDHVFKNAQDHWKVFLSSDGKLEGSDLAIGELMTRVDDYLKLYQEAPPKVGEPLEGMRKTFWGMRKELWGMRKHLDLGIRTWRGIKEFHQYVPPVILPDKLLNEAGKDRQTPWPTARLPLVQDLLLVAFPVIVYEDDRHVVAMLNSSTCPGASVMEGAIGTLGRVQLIRLQELLQSREGKCAVILLHHHLGCTPEAKDAFTDIELKALQLEEAQQVCDILASHKPAVALHGHKHVGYSASYKDSAMILSGASVAYGDKRGKAGGRNGDNCHVYNIEPNGQVSLAASTCI